MFADFKGKGIGKTSQLDAVSELTQASGFITEAIKEDDAGNYDKAVTLYTKGLDCFQTHLKYDKNQASRKAITEKVCRCLWQFSAKGTF